MELDRRRLSHRRWKLQRRYRRRNEKRGHRAGVYNKLKKMPRKVSYGVDFDEEYDAYDAYDDDNYTYSYDNGIEEHENVPKFDDSK
ncbi:hypothetical protein L2E82_22776 [Cichorium intybus]|uniref:Uncharacterized protein n=1 Tax=Cichorium intybus TaxID=13427 RepID=A0ACB9DZ04_CICIN|nr:hypothetical protein L2E82_22776 [Cichorium intybus]